MRRVGALVALLTFSVARASALEEASNKPEMYRIEHGELTLGTFNNGQSDLVSMGPGLCLNEPATLLIASKLKGLEAENKSLKESLDAVPPPSFPTWLIVGSLALGFLAGGVAALAVKR